MRTPLFSLVLALHCAVTTSGATARSASKPDYIHNIYLTMSRPSMARQGRWVYDVGTPERLDDMFGELRQLGVNAVTYHSAYRKDGADYTPRHSDLKRAQRWPEGREPVTMFLDACHRHGMAGYLAVFLFDEMDTRTARLASEDMMRVFSTHPALRGFVPPIEGAPNRGIDTATFLDICRRVKQLDPALSIMDYPNGPYSQAVMQTIVARGASDCVDIENVQFHVADERLRNAVVSRGMTHLVTGMCARSRPIVHSHYKYGGGKAWLKEQDAYKVRQGAVLSATPWGTSIFSFQHGFWGEETGPGNGLGLWRRLAWYEGILAVQRFVPVLHGSTPQAHVGVMVPAFTLENGQELVERYWAPFQNTHIPVQFLVYTDQLTPSVAHIVCPSLESCDTRQLREIDSFVQRGGTLLLPCRPSTNLVKSASPRARRILGAAAPRPLKLDELSAAFRTALGPLSDDGFVPPVDTPSMARCGRGHVVKLPADAETLARELTKYVQVQLPSKLGAAHLPDSYMTELWQTTANGASVPFIVILGTEPGTSAPAGTLQLPWLHTSPGKAWFIDRDRVLPVGCSRIRDGLEIALPDINDEYGLVVLGNTVQPTLRPTPLLTRTETGSSTELACHVVNTTGQNVKGTLNIKSPNGWTVALPDDLEFRLQPDQDRLWRITVSVPDGAERRPHFVLFECGSQTQRCVIFPTDGTAQRISAEPVPEQPPARKARVYGRLDSEWRSVTAGEARDATLAGHIPGVCFLPGSPEWDDPAEHNGKVARYGEILPRLGGPNFYVTNPDPNADVEVRITYCSDAAGTLRAYDGAAYHTVGTIAASQDWTTASFSVPKSLLASPKLDMNRRAGTSMLLDVRVNGVYVHRIEARAAPE